MSDQMWRILVGGAIMGLLVGFAPQIKEFLHRIGYRDWRDR